MTLTLSILTLSISIDFPGGCRKKCLVHATPFIPRTRRVLVWPVSRAVGPHRAALYAFAAMCDAVDFIVALQAADRLPEPGAPVRAGTCVRTGGSLGSRHHGSREIVSLTTFSTKSMTLTLLVLTLLVFDPHQGA